MAEANALWRATEEGCGLRQTNYRNNEFLYAVFPRHFHLKDLSDIVVSEIARVGGIAWEILTISVDDGIAMC